MRSYLYYILNSCIRYGKLYLTRLSLAGIALICSSLLHAKTVVLGTGTGTITQTSMTGLIAGDTLAITAGTYAGGANFSNLHDLTIINRGGVVTFTGTVNWGGTTMHNIKWTGVGYTGAFYGFVFNTATGIYGQTIHTDSTRFDHMDFENASTAAFDFGDSNFGNTYNGTNASLKMHCMTFSDIKVFNSSLFIITGYNDPSAANNNICDSIDMHNIIIQDLQGPGQQVRGTLTHFNMYNWTITYSGTNTLTGDQGILYISGNGSIHHNYMHGGRGYLARIVSFSLKPLQDSVLFYNNIILSTTHYGGLDIRCDSVDIPWGSSPYLNPIKNVYVVNNTVGNKWNQGFVVPVVVQYQMHNNNILYCKNNLSFAADPNVTNLPSDGIIVDYNQGNGITDTSNNKYFSAAAILSFLQDTLATCRPKASSALNGAGLPFNFLSTDFYKSLRPTPPSIGAVEYAGISSTVIANAGPNQTINLPLDSVTLTGLASTAINATVSSYQWAQISGPTIANLKTPNSGTTIAATLKVGTYVFGLKVKDSNNDSSASTVTITVNAQNFPPVVSAGTNQTITLPTSTVSLTGTATDATGTIASYLWSQVSGPNTATIVNRVAISTNITGLIAGSYVFQLQATDNLGLTGSATVTITVNPQNFPPVVTAGTNQTISAPVSSVTLTGTATDATGTIASLLWTQVSGPNTASFSSKATLSTNVTGLIAGVYVFQLQATDNFGLSGNASVTITVNAQNFPPVVNAGLNQTIKLPTNSVTLTGTATDATGTITTLIWTQVSGPNTATIVSKSSLTTNITGLIVGSYLFQLQATDNQGLSGTSSVTITVDSATPPVIANLPPIANAGSNQTITAPVSTINLDGSLSNDPDGSIATYVWSQVSGPNSGSFSSPNTVKSTVSGLVAGVYIFKLTVTDNLGLSASSQITITVNVATAINPILNNDPQVLMVYPNPAISNMHVSVSNSAKGLMTMTIVDVKGNLISSQSVQKNTNNLNTSLNVSQLQSGIYFLITSINKSSYPGIKFIKM